MSASQYGISEMNHPRAEKPAWSFVLARTYGLYTRNFWPYFRIALVPALAAYFFQYLVRLLTLRLVRSGTLIFPSAKFSVVATGLEWFRNAGFWIISAFFFAAISASFTREPSEQAPALADAYTLPRKRLGALLTVALLTWTLFWLGQIFVGAAMTLGVFRFLDPSKHYWLFMGVLGVMIVMVAGLVSKFGLAVPELMHDHTLSAGSAVKKSWKRTEGWELFSMMFLVKSALLGFGAFWIAGAALNWSWNHWEPNPQLYSWIEWAVYLCIAAALESPLFIAFSVLNQELQPRDTFSQSPVTASAAISAE